MIVAVGLFVDVPSQHPKLLELSPYDGKIIKLNYPISYLIFKANSSSLSLNVINGSYTKVFNLDDKTIYLIKLNSTKGEAIILNNGSSNSFVYYSLDELYSPFLIHFMLSIILFIVGGVLVLSFIKRKN
ncbi:hypothetical protein CM19_02305 [Candidatus Acidianus copahuensis]|uniref:Uncharacterized protein n=2 Tax=Sulfolobaceae TaxID=118883 RepID=A0A031LTU3_9CREN|nr:hypothetical protein CM19_02305 [Candidatus Acidianus copahuensis]